MVGATEAAWPGCARFDRIGLLPAGVAQLAERDLPKVEAAGSIPVSRSTSYRMSDGPASAGPY